MRSGTTSACIRAYAATLPKGTKDANEHRQDFKDFLGLTFSSVRRIVHGGHNTLNGLTLVKTQRFLEFKGFEITDLEDLPELFRDLGDAAVYGFVTVEELQERIGYAHSNGVYRLFNGDARKLPQDKIAIIKAIVAEHRDKIAAARDKWRKRIQPIHPTKSVPTRPASENGTKPRATSDDEVVFAGLAKALEPAAKRLLDPARTPADRKRLREAVGVDVLFSLSTALNQLGSEAAFRQYAGRTRGPRTSNKQ